MRHSRHTTGDCGPGCEVLSSSGEDLLKKYLVKWIDPEREEIGVYARNGEPAEQPTSGPIDLGFGPPKTVVVPVPGLRFTPSMPEGSVKVFIGSTWRHFKDLEEAVAFAKAEADSRPGNGSPVVRNHPKRMSAREFRKLGYLQDANRRYFHPLGMALEVVIEEDGSEAFGEIWDYRDDPEGLLFSEEDWTVDAVDVQRSIQIKADRANKVSARLKNHGFVIQPLPKSHASEGSS